MLGPFSQMRALENRRVRMHFQDDGGVETVATLLSATEDFDGSQHLIYDRVESGNELKMPGKVFHADAKLLLSIEPMS